MCLADGRSFFFFSSHCRYCDPSLFFRSPSQEWDRRGKPGGSFFKWLSTPEVQLEGCPRHELESDVVHYCRPEERNSYALRLDVTPEVRKNYPRKGGGGGLT